MTSFSTKFSFYDTFLIMQKAAESEMKVKFDIYPISPL